MKMVQNSPAAATIRMIVRGILQIHQEGHQEPDHDGGNQQIDRQVAGAERQIGRAEAHGKQRDQRQPGQAGPLPQPPSARGIASPICRRFGS